MTMVMAGSDVVLGKCTPIIDLDMQLTYAREQSALANIQALAEIPDALDVKRANEDYINVAGELGALGIQKHFEEKYGDKVGLQNPPKVICADGILKTIEIVEDESLQYWGALCRSMAYAGVRPRGLPGLLEVLHPWSKHNPVKEPGAVVEHAWLQQPEFRAIWAASTPSAKSLGMLGSFGTRVAVETFLPQYRDVVGGRIDSGRLAIAS